MKINTAHTHIRIYLNYYVSYRYTLVLPADVIRVRSIVRYYAAIDHAARVFRPARRVSLVNLGTAPDVSQKYRAAIMGAKLLRTSVSLENTAYDFGHCVKYVKQSDYNFDNAFGFTTTFTVS